MKGSSSRWWRAGHGARLGRLALTLGIALVGVLPRSARADQATPASAPASGRTISAATLETRYGVRIDRIAVIGGGGLVDFRFTVLDPAKARPILAEHGKLPRLMAEGSESELQAPSHGAMRNVRIQKNAACFLLYPNARSVIHPGTRVAVAFGDVRVEPVVAN